MRSARIKVSTIERDSVYHVMTRTVNGAFLLDDPAKETLRKQLWQIADYCGVHGRIRDGLKTLEARL